VRGDRALSFDVVLNTLLRYKNCFLMCPSSMVRASVYRELRGYREAEFRNTSDLDMWLRIARAYRVGVLEDRLFSYRYGHGNSAQRYHHLRVEQERYFLIMDVHLRDSGALASPEALKAYEAHRGEDGLMRAISAYVLGQVDESRRILRGVSIARLVGSRSVQRWRLAILFGVLQVVLRLPRVSLLARTMEWRFHGSGQPRPNEVRPRFARA
jgi:hypothetical protein